jgi:hypothetical protein
MSTEEVPAVFMGKDNLGFIQSCFKHMLALLLNNIW